MQDGLIWIMFIDYVKAFDTVAHNKLSKALVEFGVPQHLVWVVEQLCSRVTGVIRVNGAHTDCDSGLKKLYHSDASADVVQFVW